MTALDCSMILQNNEFARFTPTPGEKSKNAAKGFSEFCCYKLAGVQTESLAEENEEEGGLQGFMVYSKILPEILGGIYNDGGLMTSIQDNLEEIMNNRTHKAHLPPSMALKQYEKTSDSSEDMTPSEMLKPEVWGC